MSTPLITKIKNQGGTFYTFPSAGEDFNYFLNSSNKEFKFSKFVLLDLPNIKSGSNGKNVTGIEHIPSSYLKIDTSDTNKAFAESFQNYCLNLETLLTSKDSYDSSKTRTVSERIFFKWLKEMGTIRFREALVGNSEDGGERTRRTEDNLNINTINQRREIGKRFVEEDERTVASGGNYPYGHIVKYIGNIDSVNHNKYLGSSYSTIHIYVPTSVGKTPKVLFKSIIDDSNYKENTVLTNTPADTLDTEYLVGRKYNDTHPTGLDLRAHFDADSNVFTSGTIGVDGYELYKKLSGEDSFTSGWWFTTPVANSYLLEQVKLNDYRNDWLRIDGHRNSVANDKDFLRSRLDGITIDFDLSTSYSDNLDKKYNTWEDYNRSELATDFEFNVVLVYYDLIDKTDSSNTVTNLFGVYFVDKWNDTLTDGFEIPKFKKFKPSTITRQNGNGYAFDINLRLDLNSNDAVTETTINEYNNYSMHLYSDALENMKRSHELLIESIASTKVLIDKVDSLEDQISNTETLNDLSARLDTIEDSLISSQNLLADSTSVMSLIDRNYQEILNIYKNETSVQMAYNLNVLQQGRGTILDRSIPGKIKISNSNEGYSLSEKPILTWEDLNYNSISNSYEFVYSLKGGHNYLKFFSQTGVANDAKNLTNSENIIFYINDSSVKWEKGQSLRISFGSTFILDSTLSRAILFLTDSQNELKSKDGIYTSVMGSLSGLQLLESKGKPILEFICIDPITKTFEMDIIR